MHILSRPLIAACLALATPLMGCANDTRYPPQRDVVEAQTMELALDAGQVLQVAMLAERDGDAAQAIRSRYFQTAIPHAASLGDRYLGNLRVKETMIGKRRPRAIALWAFPDQAARDKFRNSPDWAEYVEMRKAGWKELHVYSVVVPRDMTLNFDPDKHYTFAAAWTRPGTASDYDGYLTGIERNFDDINARYVARFAGVDMQSTVESVPSPSHLTLVEWSGEAPDLDALRATRAYQENAERFGASVSRFDLYWVNFPLPG